MTFLFKAVSILCFYLILSFLLEETLVAFDDGDWDGITLIRSADEVPLVEP